MEKRLAAINIIISDRKVAEQVNGILHAYGQHIIGRLGLPCPEYGVNVISVVIGAPQDEISALSGKLGRLKSVTAKVTFAPEVKRNAGED